MDSRCGPIGTPLISKTVGWASSVLHWLYHFNVVNTEDAWESYRACDFECV